MKTPRSPSHPIPPVKTEPGLWLKLRREKYLWLVPLLLLIHACLAIFGVSRQSMTYDEATHLPAGYTYLSTGDFRLNPEHPPLLKLIAAWPLRGMPLPADPSPWINGEYVSAPPLATQQAIAYWHGCLSNGPLQYNFGHYFLYPVNDANFSNLTSTKHLPRDAYLHQADEMLMRSRLYMTTLSVALGLLIFLWTYQLFGFLGGAFSLVLYSFEPNFLAHAPLVTTDVGVSLFLFGAMYFLWRTFQRLTWVNLVALAFCSGCAVTAKFSGMLLLPLAIMAGCWRIFSSAPWMRSRSDTDSIASSFKQRTRYVLFIFLGISCWTYLFLWACYGFRFNMVPNPDLAAQIEQQLTGKILTGGHPPLQRMLWASERRKLLLEKFPTQETTPGASESESTDANEVEPETLGMFGKTILLLNDFKLLPEAYLYGLTYMQAFSHGRGSYLRGEHSPRGFRSYFLWTTLLKTPLPILIVLTLGCFLCIKRLRILELADGLLLMPVLLYALVTWGSHINIGHRHLLPMIPYLMVMAGHVPSLWQPFAEPTGKRMTIGILLLVIGSTQWVFPLGQRPDLVYPNYLTYFNELAGGPRHGHESLVDSNLDWGQGVLQLSEWLRANQIKESIALLSFGMSDPQQAGIVYINADQTYPFLPGPKLEEIEGVQYCAVHATIYQGAYLKPEQRERLRRWLSQGEQVALVADSILVFKLPSDDE